jgi:hypothetical protein
MARAKSALVDEAIAALLQRSATTGSAGGGWWIDRWKQHPETLSTRNNIAHWTGELGDAREASRLFRELLPDLERVLGPNHPDTLIVRQNIAYWTGKGG